MVQDGIGLICVSCGYRLVQLGCWDGATVWSKLCVQQSPHRHRLGPVRARYLSHRIETGRGWEHLCKKKKHLQKIQNCGEQCKMKCLNNSSYKVGIDEFSIRFELYAKNSAESMSQFDFLLICLGLGAPIQSRFEHQWRRVY